jgi:hypothetical protein
MILFLQRIQLVGLDHERCFDRKAGLYRSSSFLQSGPSVFKRSMGSCQALLGCSTMLDKTVPASGSFYSMPPKMPRVHTMGFSAVHVGPGSTQVIFPRRSWCRGVSCRSRLNSTPATFLTSSSEFFCVPSSYYCSTYYIDSIRTVFSTTRRSRSGLHCQTRIQPL